MSSSSKSKEIAHDSHIVFAVLIWAVLLASAASAVYRLHRSYKHVPLVFTGCLCVGFLAEVFAVVYFAVSKVSPGNDNISWIIRASVLVWLVGCRLMFSFVPRAMLGVCITIPLISETIRVVVQILEDEFHTAQLVVDLVVLVAQSGALMAVLGVRWLLISDVQDLFRSIPSAKELEILDRLEREEAYQNDENISDSKKPSRVRVADTLPLEASLVVENALEEMHKYWIPGSILQSLAKRWRAKFILLMFVKVVVEALGLLPAYLLRILVDNLHSQQHEEEDGSSGGTHERSATDLRVACVIVVAIVACSLLSTFLRVHYDLKLRKMSVYSRGVLSVAVYRHAVQLRQHRQRSSQGDIINHLTIDVQKVCDQLPSVNDVWALPLTVAFALYLMYVQVSFGFFAGLAITIALIPVNMMLAKKIGKVSKSMLAANDERVLCLTEVLTNMKYCKLCGWQDKVAAWIRKPREEYMRWLTWLKYLDAICVFFWATTPVFVSLATFSMYIGLGHTLTPGKAIAALALFNSLILPLNAYPWVLNGTVEAYVSLKRLQDFFGDSGDVLGASSQISIASPHAPRPRSSRFDEGAEEGHDGAEGEEAHTTPEDQLEDDEGDELSSDNEEETHGLLEGKDNSQQRKGQKKRNKKTPQRHIASPYATSPGWNATGFDSTQPSRGMMAGPNSHRSSSTGSTTATASRKGKKNSSVILTEEDRKNSIFANWAKYVAERSGVLSGIPAAEDHRNPSSLRDRGTVMVACTNCRFGYSVFYRLLQAEKDEEQEKETVETMKWKKKGAVPSVTNLLSVQEEDDGQRDVTEEEEHRPPLSTHSKAARGESFRETTHMGFRSNDSLTASFSSVMSFNPGEMIHEHAQLQRDLHEEQREKQKILQDVSTQVHSSKKGRTMSVVAGGAEGVARKNRNNKERVDHKDHSVSSPVVPEEDAMRNQLQPVSSASSSSPAVSLVATEKGVGGRPRQRHRENNNGELFFVQVPQFNAERGKLTVITGRAGSGKSTFLSGIASECKKLEDHHHHTRQHHVSQQQHHRHHVGIQRHSMIYVEQHPFLLTATIKENILFGLEYHPQLYAAAIQAACLNDDLEELQNGDETFVGERGSALSGGQKMRVSLARAYYSRKDLLLVDDVFGCVDPKVAKHLLQHFVLALVRQKGKCMILATHNIAVIEAADVVYHVADGQLTMVESSLEKDSFLTDLQKCGEGEEEEEERVARNNQERMEGASPSQPPRESEGTASGGCLVTAVSSQVCGRKKGRDGEENDDDGEDRLSEPESTVSAIGREIKGRGTISVQSIKVYVQHVGYVLALLVVILVAAMQAARNFSDWFIADRVHEADDNPHGFLRDLGIICLVNAGLAIGRSFAFAIAGLRAAKDLHNELLDSVLNASYSFFVETPPGRLINRLSKDIYSIDDNLPFTVNIVLAQFFLLAGAIVIIGINSSWVTFVGLIPTFVLYYFVQLPYRRCTREVKRLESASRSPIIDNLKDMLEGGVLIRSLGATCINRFIHTSIFDMTQLLRTNYNMMLLSAWFSLRLQFIGCLVTAMVGAVTIYYHGSKNAASLGLALAYVSPLTSYMSGVLNSVTEVEKLFISVERVNEYLSLEDETTVLNRASSSYGAPQDEDDNVEAKVPTELLVRDPKRRRNNRAGGVAPPTVAAVWPVYGTIEFRHVFLKYHTNLPYVLRDISFKVEQGEKVAIVGRTGAGKTSILSALLRLIPIAKQQQVDSGDNVDRSRDGKILIDGINTQSLDPPRMRSRLAVLPQDPFLFHGTLQQNVDPFDNSTEDEITFALMSVGLGKLPLSFEVDTGGMNLSAGQRHLVAIVRVLLQRSCVLLLDEPSATVDAETDALLYRILATRFKHCTIIAITHKLENLDFYDKVLVLEQGQVAAFGSLTEVRAMHLGPFARTHRE